MRLHYVHGKLPDFPEEKTEGKRLAEQGMQLVLENEPPPWKMRALDLLVRYCVVQYAPFTADDLHDWWAWNKLEEPHHPNAYGAIIRVARQRGWLVLTGKYTPSRRAKRHASVIPYYRSGIAGQDRDTLD